MKWESVVLFELIDYLPCYGLYYWNDSRGREIFQSWIGSFHAKTNLRSSPYIFDFTLALLRVALVISRLRSQKTTKQNTKQKPKTKTKNKQKSWRQLVSTTLYCVLWYFCVLLLMPWWASNINLKQKTKNENWKKSYFTPVSELCGLDCYQLG